MRVLPIAVLALAVSGCYTYTPLATSELKPSAQLRVELTLTGGDSLARFLGPSVQSVDGRLVVATPTSYEIGVTQVTMYSGMEQFWKGETVTLPKPYVSRIEERTFSYGKTGLLAAIIVVTGYALKSTNGFGAFGHTTTPPPPM